MTDDGTAVDRDELIGRLRSDLGCEAPSEVVTHSSANDADTKGDSIAGLTPLPKATLAISRSALEIADRILGMASAKVQQ